MQTNTMIKRWLSLYVENDIGVLAKISGLFSGKAYNLESLTVGTTEDPSISRMTITLVSDDITFEQIKKQLNRCIEVIKVIDLSNLGIHMKEICYIKIKNCSARERADVFRIADIFHIDVVDYGKDSILLEAIQTESKNNDIIHLLKDTCKTLEIVRGGSVAIESISLTER